MYFIEFQIGRTHLKWRVIRSSLGGGELQVLNTSFIKNKRRCGCNTEESQTIVLRNSIKIIPRLDTWHQLSKGSLMPPQYSLQYSVYYVIYTIVITCCFIICFFPLTDDYYLITHFLDYICYYEISYMVALYHMPACKFTWLGLLIITLLNFGPV